jgi:hypothetical protein
MKSSARGFLYSVLIISMFCFGYDGSSSLSIISGDESANTTGFI